jgi:cytochrome P450
MSTFFILRDPNIFPEPENFTPERWLLEPDELQQLERYLLPASKGTLGCLGQKYGSLLARRTQYPET